MAEKPRRKKSNAEPMTYESSRVPNLVDQRAREQYESERAATAAKKSGTTTSKES